jgi:hypothetical protein
MIERRKSNFDRRFGKERRSAFKFRLFLNKKVEKRRGKERRAKYESRQGWVRIGKWSSVLLDGLKIKKFLH